jgi:hypothetical protein
MKSSNLHGGLSKMKKKLLVLAMLIVLSFPLSFLLLPTTSLSAEEYMFTTDSTDSTDLPIDITAIGRGERTEALVSLRFFEMDLFSAHSQAVNDAMARQMYYNRLMMNSGLFHSFEGLRAIDINERTAYAAANLNLFAQPVSFRSIGQTDMDDAIPIWVIVSVMAVCAVLGYVFARMFVAAKEQKEPKEQKEQK